MEGILKSKLEWKKVEEGEGGFAEVLFSLSVGFFLFVCLFIPTGERFKHQLLQNEHLLDWIS